MQHDTLNIVEGTHTESNIIHTEKKNGTQKYTQGKASLLCGITFLRAVQEAAVISVNEWHNIARNLLKRIY